jgi:predicted ABC-type ATPase
MARCPWCGHTELAPGRAMFVVTGASGSGKTTVYPEVAAALTGRCVTFDVDLLLDSDDALIPAGPTRGCAARMIYREVAGGGRGPSGC